MEGKLGQTTPAHILVASPAICKDLVDKLWVCQVKTSSFEEIAEIAFSRACNINNKPDPKQEPAYSLPLYEINIQVSGKVIEAGIIDPGLQIVII
jgi:hypothetical protein